MTAYERLKEIRRMASGHEPIEAIDAENWVVISRKAARMETALNMIIDIVDEYETTLGKIPELMDAMEGRR